VIDDAADQRRCGPQPTVNRVGPGWDQARGRSDASENITYPPLFDPRVAYTLPAGPRPEPPPPPTEAELLARLAEARTANHDAQAALEAAQAAHARAVELVQLRKQELAGFSGFDSEQVEKTVEALRDGGSQPRVDRMRRSQREHAKADLVAAETALQVLEDDVAGARARAQLRRQAAIAAGIRVLGLEAERIAARHAELLVQADALIPQLQALDQLSAGSRVPLPPAVVAVVRASYASGFRRIDQSQWQAKLDALLEEEAA